MSRQKKKKCPDCGKGIADASQRCRSCASKATWRDQAFRTRVAKRRAFRLRAKALGLELPEEYRPKFCPDCGVKIDRRSRRCLQCTTLARWQNSERRLKPKRCVDCDRQISPKATRCQQCASRKRKALWQDPEYRKRQAEARRIRLQDPEYLRKRAEELKARRAREKDPNLCIDCGCRIDPDATRCRKCAGKVYGERLRTKWRDPEYRCKRVEYMKAQWRDPEFREKRLEAIARGRQRQIGVADGLAGTS